MADFVVESVGALLAGEVEQAAIARLLNTFLREVVAASEPSEQQAPSLQQSLRRFGRPLCIELAHSKLTLMTAARRASPSGHHELGGEVHLLDQRGRARELRDAVSVARALLDELRLREGDSSDVGRRHAELLADIERSLANTRLFANAALSAPSLLTLRGAARVSAAERSLVFGHPFHPAPKSDDAGPISLTPYRPELAASFQLHYLAVAPDARVERRLSGEQALEDPAVREEARARLPSSAQDWPLLPVHPWQVTPLLAQAELAPLVRRDRVIPLGALGEPVVATSSVRTVYAPAQQMFLKLSLSARITNFVRENPREQLERSLDASKVLDSLGSASQGLTILPELAYRGLCTGVASADGAAFAKSAVLYRCARALADHGESGVVASLLEPPLHGREATIIQLLRQAAIARGAQLTTALVGSWLAAYCHAVFVPALALFFRHGVSLEAHVQNSLVDFRDGWPVRLLVRDLEGTTISRRHALEQSRYHGLLSDDSPVLVDEKEAWQRVLYYLIVNHAMHVVSTLAAYGPAEEWQLWLVLRASLQDGLDDCNGYTPHLHELFERSELPAKANLISRFAARSERPLYVSVPNPLCPEVIGT